MLKLLTPLCRIGLRENNKNITMAAVLPPGWPAGALALPGPPPDADIASIPTLGITRILTIDVEDPAANIATTRNITDIGAAVTAGVGIQKFVDSVARIVGFQPVPQKTRQSTVDGAAIDLDPDAYLGKFLQWGNVNREMFKRVMYTLFNNYAGEMQANVATAIAGNATHQVDMTVRAKHFVDTHSPLQTFSKYLTPTPAATPLPASPFMMTIPTYDVRQVAAVRQAGTGISNYRKRAMQRGFFRMERLNSAMIWINHIGDEMRAAKAAVAALGLSGPAMAAIRNAGGGGVAGAGAGAGGAVPTNSILAYLFEAE